MPGLRVYEQQQVITLTTKYVQCTQNCFFFKYTENGKQQMIVIKVSNFQEKHTIMS